MQTTYRSAVMRRSGAWASLACFALTMTVAGGSAAQAATSSQARAPAAWRCGNTYTDQPCAGGRTVQADDTRGAEARQAADEATRRSERAADAMERDRLRLERTAAARSGATVFADHRVGEANERAVRRAAEATARERHDKANKSSRAGKAGKKHSANGDFIARTDAPADANASSGKKKREPVK